MLTSIDFLSYHGERNNDIHAHAQFVIPISGGMELEIGGSAGRLDESRAAFIAPGLVHSQRVTRLNRFLILNCEVAELGASVAEQLAERRFLHVSPAARNLVDFAAAATNNGFSAPQFSRHWVPLLAESLLGFSFARPLSRLSGLVRQVEAALDGSWTVGEMARLAGVSASRLHALFLSEFRQTPQEWLTSLRIGKVLQWLESTDLPVAELALKAGYSDQAALTRAMRRVTGRTPAAYRRGQRESGTKKQ